MSSAQTAPGQEVEADHTSVPRWGRDVPEVDPSGRHFAVIAIGRPARAVGEAWAERIAASGAPCWVCYADEPDEPLLRAFRERLATAVVGWRLMLAGPEAQIARLRSEAVRAGAVPAEIRMHATETRSRRVYCPHCRSITEADVAVGGRVTCHGCGLTLVCDRHFSRRLAAYMGYAADAEDAP
ncbi:dimethylamine monooxygenase subunit DmmA family protein [Actinomadura sp. NPDC047616]|uniref:dimethylamine monooxygenase subunit DmmA family protein n=1 Tax=Actinomadura sp. NPDC047616 TaxID=3155914 RepID=UPI0033DAFE84